MTFIFNEIAMMPTIKNLTIAFVTLLLFGCASQTNWTPTVDPYSNSANSSQLNRDMYECRQIAEQVSGGTATETAKGVGVGGLLGAASGAAIGAIAGNAGKGAAIGATAGAIGGGTRQGLRAEDQYKRAYSNCLKNRGHAVVNY